MRILLADDHDLVRETMAAFLVAEGQAEVATAGSLPEALEIVAADRAFDLVLLDYNMPGMNGLEGLRRMQHGECRHARGDPLGHDDARAGRRGDRGRGGRVRAEDAGVEVHDRRRALHGRRRGLRALQLHAAEEPRRRPGLLTSRELEVLQGICRGQSNKEIALDYDLHEATVKLHAKTLCRKLGPRTAPMRR
jgi:two-component system, NarL family, nitrate/nitrite response regulator NarL